MIEGFIVVGVLILIVATHILLPKIAFHLQKKYEGDTKKTRIAAFMLFMPLSLFFLLIALVLIRITS